MLAVAPLPLRARREAPRLLLALIPGMPPLTAGTEPVAAIPGGEPTAATDPVVAAAQPGASVSLLEPEPLPLVQAASAQP